MTVTPKPFNCFEITLIIFSFVAYLVDTVTDVLVAVLYYHEGHYVWASLTLGIVVLASVAIQIFSGRWYVADGRSQTACCWFSHILQLQPFERYMHVLKAGWNARKYKTAEQIDLYYYQQNDVSMLRLFESFLESAPQLTLQMYIVLCTDSAHWLTGLSAFISLLALGWAVASYSHALRQAYQEQYSIHAPGLFVQTICHVAIAASRVCAIVAFAAVFNYWVFVALGVHWILMTIWVMLQDTDFCPSKVEEKLFDCVVAVIYCFTFFNLKDGRTRWRALTFYTIMALENGAAVSVWYIYHEPHHWYDPAIIAAEIAMFLFGIVCMLLYYRFCHPSGPVYCCCTESDDEKPTQSTPNFNRSASIRHSRYQKNSSAPVYTSTVQLPRRTLLKPQNSKINVEYKEVYTPSQLSPIKSPRPMYNDCSLQFDDTSGFHHYSIDATAGLMPPSRVATLQGNGIDLSSDDCTHFGSFNKQPRPYFHSLDFDTSGVALTDDDLSVGCQPLSYDIDSAVYDQPSEDYYTKKDDDENIITDECPRCRKTFKYMDQSIHSMGNCTVAYCHCTLSEEHFLGGTEGTNYGNHSSASESSGFQSHAGFHVPQYNFKDVYPNKPSKFEF